MFSSAAPKLRFTTMAAVAKARNHLRETKDAMPDILVSIAAIAPSGVVA
jgi:hypothetical protein